MLDFGLLSVAVLLPRVSAIQDYLGSFFNFTRCSSKEILKNYDHFATQGGLKASACPNKRHLVAYAMTSCENSNGDRPSEGQTRGSEGANILASLSHTRRPRSALVIGGNTGSDCVGFARFLSGDADVSLHSWVANVERLHAKKGLKFPEAACLGSGKTNTSEYPLLPQASLASVVCVEPLPSNFQVLQRAGRLGWNRIKFINAAVSRHIPPAGTIPFPSEFKFG